MDTNNWCIIIEGNTDSPAITMTQTIVMPTYEKNMTHEKISFSHVQKKPALLCMLK